MVKLLWGLLKTIRPRQWIKNFAVFAALILAGSLFQTEDQIKSVYAFALFCGFSSASYILNDLFDIERDKLHPFKKARPIAFGIVPPYLAITLAFAIILICLPLSYKLSPAFFGAGVLYLVLQLLYSAFLKHVILLDVMVIATGFVLRVYGGVWAINAHLSVWFLLSVTSFALFLAIGKRRSELTLLQAQASQHRKTLSHYPESLMDILTSMFANSTWLTYALYAFQQPPILTPPKLIEFWNQFDLPFIEAKYFMASVPIVIYAVMRYLYIIYEKKEGESPERVILTDKPLLISTLLWLVTVIFIIYYL